MQPPARAGALLGRGKAQVSVCPLRRQEGYPRVPREGAAGVQAGLASVMECAAWAGPSIQLVICGQEWRCCPEKGQLYSHTGTCSRGELIEAPLDATAKPGVGVVQEEAERWGGSLPCPGTGG